MSPPFPYLPDPCGAIVLLLPDGLAVLDFGPVGEVHDRAAVAGVYDAVKAAALGQGVHQPVVQLVINDLASLQRGVPCHKGL